ncbi:MAG: GntR family transcriptional regulator [Pikeienuella sp.]
MGTQADQVRDDIIGRVQARKLLPGDVINEDELRTRLNLSSTPVREALIALEATGVIERRPRAGARIVQLDLEGLVKLLEAHAEAEGAVAYRAARRVNKVQAAEIEQALIACEQFDESAPEPKVNYFDLNMAFHQSLMNAAGNVYLSEMLFQRGNRLIGYLYARHNLAGESARSAADHRRIYQAIIDGDCDGARATMISHVMMDDAKVLDVINQMKHPLD